MQLILYRLITTNLVWFSIFMPFYWLRRKTKVDYIHYFWITALLFGFGSWLTVHVFPGIFQQSYLHTPTKPALTVLFITYAITLAVYLTQRTNKIHKRHMQFTEFDLRYLFSKSFEIMFQQTLILVGVISLQNVGFPLLLTMIVFSLIFAGYHYFLFRNLYRTKRVDFSIFVIFTVASAVGGVLYPFIILVLPAGYVISFSIHVMYYTILGVLLTRKTQTTDKKTAQLFSTNF